jgi:hypothetical protein
MTSRERYIQCFDRISPYILGSQEITLTPEVIQIVVDTKYNLEQLIAESPTNSAMHWLMGKIYQFTQEHDQAYESFKTSRECLKTFDGKERDELRGAVFRELGYECLHLKKWRDAEYFCRLAVELEPEDLSLYINLSLASLFTKKLEEAEKNAVKGDDPQITEFLLEVIKKIRSEEMEFPTDFTPFDI